MIPTKIFFQIHDSRRLLITYWLNDFLSGNLVVLYNFFGVQTSVFIQTWYNQSLCPGMEFFLELNIKHQSYWRNKRTVSPECSNYIRVVREHAPRNNFLKLDSRKRHILWKGAVRPLCCRSRLINLQQPLVKKTFWTPDQQKQNNKQRSHFLEKEYDKIWAGLDW